MIKLSKFIPLFDEVSLHKCACAAVSVTHVTSVKSRTGPNLLINPPAKREVIKSRWSFGNRFGNSYREEQTQNLSHHVLHLIDLTHAFDAAIQITFCKMQSTIKRWAPVLRELGNNNKTSRLIWPWGIYFCGELFCESFVLQDFFDGYDRGQNRKIHRDQILQKIMLHDIAKVCGN